MIDDVFLPGVQALPLGAIAGALLLVPFVAISYRSRSTVTLGRSVLWAAALVYSWSIWTYTLLPLPDPGTIECADRNTTWGSFVGDVLGAVRAAEGSVITLLTDPVVLQLGLNVVLFVPLGFFLRALGGQGVLVAAIVGCGVSGIVETTQLTGVFGLYECA